MRCIIKIEALLLFLVAFSFQACADYRSEPLVEAIKSTPFSAVVSHSERATLVSNANDYDVYMLVADVIEMISGEKHTSINYRMYVEPGEKILLNNAPVILTLCENDGEYYWPGVGAEFPADSELIKTAHQAAKSKLTPSGDEGYCK